jgi:hypothetical protein
MEAVLQGGSDNLGDAKADLNKQSKDPADGSFKSPPQRKN